MEPHSSSTPKQTEETGRPSTEIQGGGSSAGAIPTRMSGTGSRGVSFTLPADFHGFLFEKVLSPEDMSARADRLSIPRSCLGCFPEPGSMFWIALPDLSKRWMVLISGEDDHSLAPWYGFVVHNQLYASDSVSFFRCPSRYCAYTVQIRRSERRFMASGALYADPNPMKCKRCEESGVNRLGPPWLRAPAHYTPPTDGGRNKKKAATLHRFKLDGEPIDPHENAPSIGEASQRDDHPPSSTGSCNPNEGGEASARSAESTADNFR